MSSFCLLKGAYITKIESEVEGKKYVTNHEFSKMIISKQNA